MKIFILSLLVALSFSSYATVFPTAKGKMIYTIKYQPVENNAGELYFGEMTLELYEVEDVGGEVTTKYFEHSSVFPRLKYFEITESKDSLVINGATFVGPGSDPVEMKSDLMPLPLEVGNKIDAPLMYSKIQSVEKMNILGKELDAYKLYMIGSHQDYYTMTGNYWVAEGLGIVAGKYTTVDGWMVEFKLNRME